MKKIDICDSWYRFLELEFAKDYFKELTDQDVRKRLYDEQKNQIEQDMAPFGFIVTGLEEENIGEVVDEYGTKWNPIVRNYETNW